MLRVGPLGTWKNLHLHHPAHPGVTPRLLTRGTLDLSLPTPYHLTLSGQHHLTRCTRIGNMVKKLDDLDSGAVLPPPTGSLRRLARRSIKLNDRRFDERFFQRRMSDARTPMSPTSTSEQPGVRQWGLVTVYVRQHRAQAETYRFAIEHAVYIRSHKAHGTEHR